mmetsp:Transcript_10841/g.36792  ORF Transcript_10841/g.36792 Transcript_10841/m.36792 type:complete len:92 (-) Transcript_10841:193-468(-)
MARARPRAAPSRRACFGCEARASETKLITCTGCMVARFCDKDCQRKAWKRWHKRHCPRFRAQAPPQESRPRNCRHALRLERRASRPRRGRA